MVNEFTTESTHIPRSATSTIVYTIPDSAVMAMFPVLLCLILMATGLAELASTLASC